MAAIVLQEYDAWLAEHLEDLVGQYRRKSWQSTQGQQTVARSWLAVTATSTETSPVPPWYAALECLGAAQTSHTTSSVL
jgi:hypothetical protein